MKFLTELFLICAILLGSMALAHAQNQPSTGTVGLTASLQGNQTNIKFPVWATENIVVAPVLGLNHRAESFTSLNIGVSPRYYNKLGSDFASYIGALAILQRTSPELGANDTDFLLGAAGGGEFFADEHFSFGIEGQLNYLFNDNDNDALSTGAAITGTYYF